MDKKEQARRLQLSSQLKTLRKSSSKGTPRLPNNGGPVTVESRSVPRQATEQTLKKSNQRY